MRRDKPNRRLSPSSGRRALMLKRCHARPDYKSRRSRSLSNPPDQRPLDARTCDFAAVVRLVLNSEGLCQQYEGDRRGLCSSRASNRHFGALTSGQRSSASHHLQPYSFRFCSDCDADWRRIWANCETLRRGGSVRHLVTSARMCPTRERRDIPMIAVRRRSRKKACIRHSENCVPGRGCIEGPHAKVSETASSIISPRMR
jgi:hypothetical protein